MNVLRPMSPAILPILRGETEPTGEFAVLYELLRGAYQDGFKGLEAKQYTEGAISTTWAEYRGCAVEALTARDCYLVKLLSNWELRAWEQGRSDAEAGAEA